jgi:cardiolipin synthase
MKLSLQLKLGQQLTMTPQLQQAIKLLQLSTLDLQQEIQEALESNPMLEIEEDFDTSPETLARDKQEQGGESNPLDADGSDGDFSDSEFRGNDEEFQEAPDFNSDESWNEADIPEDLSVDSSWDDVYTNNQSSGPSSGDSDEYDGDFESRNSIGTTLQDHLHWQLNLTPMSDTDLQLTGPVVVELQKLFVETWEGQDGQPLAAKDYFPKPKKAGSEVVRAIGSTPDESFSLIYATLLSAIASAETSVYITNAYFVPDPQLLEALEASAGRGVDVTLILPSATDSWLVFHAGRRHYDRLLRAGVKIYERHGALLHSKTALVDGVWATVGSTNLDWRSFLHNRELNAVVLGREFGGQVRAMFERDLAQSDAITLHRWRHRPLTFRAMELYARAWEYWL